MSLSFYQSLTFELHVKCKGDRWNAVTEKHVTENRQTQVGTIHPCIKSNTCMEYQSEMIKHYADTFVRRNYLNTCASDPYFTVYKVHAQSSAMLSAIVTVPWTRGQTSSENLHVG